MHSSRWLVFRLAGFLAGALAACGDAATTGPLGAADAGPDARPDAPGGAPATAYRWSSLRLADPHLWFGSGDLCVDITETVNTFATNVLQVDDSKPADGLLDGSIALVFRPYNPAAGATSPVSLEAPVCTAPAPTSTCTAAADTPSYAMVATSRAEGACIDILPGTISGRLPDVPMAPCFGTAGTTIKLSFLGAQITLQDARGAAGVAGAKLDPGLIRGFLSLADARAIQIVVPGFISASLASFLYGGGSCHDSTSHPTGDMDTGPDGQLGWWVYVSFSAIEVPYQQR